MHYNATLRAAIAVLDIFENACFTNCNERILWFIKFSKHHDKAYHKILLLQLSLLIIHLNKNYNRKNIVILLMI